MLRRGVPIRKFTSSSRHLVQISAVAAWREKSFTHLVMSSSMNKIRLYQFQVSVMDQKNTWRGFQAFLKPQGSGATQLVSDSKFWIFDNQYTFKCDFEYICAIVSIKIELRFGGTFSRSLNDLKAGSHGIGRVHLIFVNSGRPDVVALHIVWESTCTVCHYSLCILCVIGLLNQQNYSSLLERS